MHQQGGQNVRGSAPALNTYYIVDQPNLALYEIHAHGIFIDHCLTLSIEVSGEIVSRIPCDAWGFVQAPNGKFVTKPYQTFEGFSA
jgi:hypothetical protein